MDRSGPLGTYSTPPRAFEAHMRWVVDSGHNAMTMGHLTACMDGERPLPENPLVITFDDGLADFVLHAAPVLADLGLPCTMYVTTAAAWTTRQRTLGGRPTMSWRQLIDLDALDVEIGAHGHHHPQLDLLPHRRVADEVHRSKDLLEHHLQREVGAFAYPHGYYRRTTQRLVRSAGFSTAAAVKNAVSHTEDDRWALSRLMITAEQTAADLEAGLEGGGWRMASSRGRLRSAGWRAARLVTTRGQALVHVLED